jgi:hypothetical protein
MRFNRIFLCLFLALSLILAGCEGDMASEVDSPPADEVSRPTAEKTAFPSALIFVGDSTTAHMASRSALREEQVWATKSRYLNLGPRVCEEKIVLPGTGEELTVAEAAARVKPAFLVVTLGIDYGVYYYRNEPLKFAFYYGKLVDGIRAASPDTEIILQSVYPVGRESAVITPEMVRKANETVKRVAEERGLFFLDTYPLLVDKEGYLAPEYCSSADGIHLTRAAYEVVLSHMKEKEALILGGAA